MHFGPSWTTPPWATTTATAVATEMIPLLTIGVLIDFGLELLPTHFDGFELVD